MKFLRLLTLVCCVAAFPAQLARASETDLSRDFNFRLSPIGLLFGIYGISFDFGIFRHLAITLAANWFEASHETTQIYELGAGLFVKPWALVLDDGFYARSLFYAAERTVNRANFFRSLSIQSWNTTIGYQWFFHHGLNAGLGTGVSLSNYPPSHGLNPILDADLGWAF